MLIHRHTDTQTHRHTDTGLTIDLHTFSSAHAAAIEEVGQRGGDLEANSLDFLNFVLRRSFINIVPACQILHKAKQ